MDGLLLIPNTYLPLVWAPKEGEVFRVLYMINVVDQRDVIKKAV